MCSFTDAKILTSLINKFAFQYASLVDGNEYNISEYCSLLEA